MSSVIAIEKLKPGMVIVQITKQNGPVKIRKSGLVSSEAMVQGLAEMGVQEVEVDLAQTVEIAPVVQRNTHTQALLRGDHDTSANFDKNLSDQFNRSLFLPSVQGLPSMWKVYLKDLAKYLLVILLGLGLGLSAATVSLWWPTMPFSYNGDKGSAEQNSQPSESQTAPLASDKRDQTPATSEQATDELAQPTPAQANVQAPQENNGQVSAQNATDNLVPTPENPPANTPVARQKQVSDTEAQPTANNASQSASNKTNDTVASLAGEGGEVLNESIDDSKVEVSPELLARFNAAVEALDTQAGSDDSASAPKVTVRDDIQRVDQLPVRLLTRLPSMNFSAHMYASQVEDRWVRVNGKQRFEGEWIDDKVQIINIEAQRVVLSFEGELFTMNALTDW